MNAKWNMCLYINVIIYYIGRIAIGQLLDKYIWRTKTSTSFSASIYYVGEYKVFKVLIFLYMICSYIYIFPYFSVHLTKKLKNDWNTNYFYEKLERRKYYLGFPWDKSFWMVAKKNSIENRERWINLTKLLIIFYNLS